MQSEVLVEAICSHVQSELETLGIRSTVGEAERGIVRAGLDVATLTQEDRELLARKGPTGMFVGRVESAVQAALQSAAANEVPADYTCGEVLLAVDGDLEGTLAATLGGGFEQSLYGSSPELSLLTLEPEKGASPGRSLIFTNGEGRRELDTIATTGSVGGLLSADARPGGTMTATGPMPSLGGESDASRGGDTLEQGDDLTVSQLSGVGQVASGNDLAEQLLALMESYASAGRSAGVSVLPSSREMVGKVLDDKYEIRSLLGEGGFGAVFLAYDRLTETEVAIKTIKELGPERLEMFKTEARRVARLSHQNIIQWRSLNEMSDGSVYFVMELLKGKELADIMKLEPRMPAGRAQELLLQVLRGLEHAHTRDLDDPILHLDLKPQNIFVTPAEHGGDHAKVIDFGIGGMTPEYASPEQCHMYTKPGAPPLDSRSDLYSLGITAFKLLTGEYPFEKPERRLDWLQVHQEVAPARLASKDAKVPRKLAAFVERCLEKDRDKRWPDTTTAREALEEIVSPPRRTLALVAQVVAAVLVVLGPMVYVLTRPGLPEIKLTHDGRAIAGRKQPFYFGPKNRTRKLNLTADFAAGNNALELVHDLEGAESQYWRVSKSERGSKKLTIEATPQQGTSKVRTLYLRGVTEGKQQFSEPFSVQWVGEDAWNLRVEEIRLPDWPHDHGESPAELTYNCPDKGLDFPIEVNADIKGMELGLLVDYGLDETCKAGTSIPVADAAGLLATIPLKLLLPNEVYGSGFMFLTLRDAAGNERQFKKELPRVDCRPLGASFNSDNHVKSDGSFLASIDDPLIVKVQADRDALLRWSYTRLGEEAGTEPPVELDRLRAGQQEPYRLDLPADADADYEVRLIASTFCSPEMDNVLKVLRVNFAVSAPRFAIVGFGEEIKSEQMEGASSGDKGPMKIIPEVREPKVVNRSESVITVWYQLDDGERGRLEVGPSSSVRLDGLLSAVKAGQQHHLSLWALNGSGLAGLDPENRNGARRGIDLVYDPVRKRVELLWQGDEPRYVSDNESLSELAAKVQVDYKGGYQAELRDVTVSLTLPSGEVKSQSLEPLNKHLWLAQEFEEFSLEGLCNEDGKYLVQLAAKDATGRSCDVGDPLRFEVSGRKPEFHKEPEYRKSKSEKWINPEGDWWLRLNVSDPNGLRSVSGCLAVDELKQAVKFDQEKDNTWKASVQFDSEHKWSEKKAKLSVTAVDKGGRECKQDWDIEFDRIERRLPSSVSLYSKSGGFADDAEMRLVKGNLQPYTCFGRGADDEERTYARYDDLEYPPDDRGASVELDAKVIHDFYMDVNEVTIHQFVTFVDSTGYRSDGSGWSERLSDWRGEERAGNGALPVTGVTFLEAEAYAEAVGKKLPTLVQWEYAVRGCEFLPTTRAPKLEDIGQFNAGETVDGFPARLKRKAWRVDEPSSDRSSQGIRNLCSNVAEWTSTTSKLIGADRSVWANGGKTATDGEKCFIAGGYFRSLRVDWYVNTRLRKGDAKGYVGFRCVLPAEAFEDEESRWEVKSCD